jgi:hypothetical protein
MRRLNRRGPPPRDAGSDLQDELLGGGLNIKSSVHLIRRQVGNLVAAFAALGPANLLALGLLLTKEARR